MQPEDVAARWNVAGHREHKRSGKGQCADIWGGRQPGENRDTSWQIADDNQTIIDVAVGIVTCVHGISELDQVGSSRTCDPVLCDGRNVSKPWFGVKVRGDAGPRQDQ